MFYLEIPTSLLRLGDILLGNVVGVPTLTPFDKSDQGTEYRIELLRSNYLVILDPCCSIGKNNAIVVTPLVPVKTDFYKNPLFKENILKVNELVFPQEAIPPEAWDKMSPQDKQSRLAEGLAYTFLEYFIYDSNDLLKEYEFSFKSELIKSGNYMIDFRNTIKVKSPNIKDENGPFTSKKIAELSIDARKSLREKLADFYGRPAKEDNIEDI